MVSIRITVQTLLAVAAAMSVQAYPGSYADAVESLAARSEPDYQMLAARRGNGISTSSSRQSYPRSFSNDDSLSLVARDLAALGIRSEDISHILVVRMTRPPSPVGLSKAELEKHLKELEPELTKAKNNVKTIVAAIKAARKAKNTAEEAKQKLKLEDANGMVETYGEYVQHYKAELAKAK